MTTKTKFVDVTCRQPIRLRNKIVRAIYHENLTTQEIADCISQHAVVEEILPTGAKVVLDFTNYDKFEAPKAETKPAPKKEVKEEAKPAPEVKPEAKPAKEEVKEETKPAKEEKPVVAPVKEEEVVEDADQKVEEAKKATKEKK